MPEYAIRVNEISKRYRIGGQAKSHDTLLASMAGLFANPLSSYRRLRSLVSFSDNNESNTIWALRDISFDILEGKTVGLIGRNGSGKSTLLKIMSRITEPSTGEISLKGRTASLLEVGTGFHPELTGRDNVYLNGAILGMSRPDVTRKFDEIISFSGVEKFIDTPVKHYSSGMKVRLGFAVAAHLEPEILLVDEVLAVGDAEFQKRCMKKMGEVGGEGRTVIFVSHHLPSVARLCSRSILLESGEVVADGDTSAVLQQYSERLLETGSEKDWRKEEAPGDDVVRLLSVAALVDGVPAPAVIDVCGEVTIAIEYEVYSKGYKITPAIHVFDGQSNWVFASIDIDPVWHNKRRDIGRYRASAIIPSNIFAEGTFTIGVSIASLEPTVDHLFDPDCVSFTTYDPVRGDSARGEYHGSFPGSLRPKLVWTNELTAL